jgi:tetratricopeptide (TPR) repeat protein
MARVFISHSSKDQEQAARLLTWLRSRGFTEVFLDFDKHAGLAPGSDWERTLYREMAAAEGVVLLLTKNWFDSKWCFAEFTQARALGKAMFPLVETPTGETFVAADIQHIDLVKDRDGGLDMLSGELTRLAMSARGGFPWDRTRSPFPGLLAFDEADAAIYFGRDDDIRRLIERLNARRAQGGEKLIALLGASGSGKSSLLRAGVLPRLKRDKRNWLTLEPFRPQIHPMAELSQAIALALGPGGNWQQVHDALAGADPTDALHRLARDLRAASGANEATILISIDQGEELFGAADKAEAERFFTVLNIALGEHLPFMAVLALRSDFLGQLQTAQPLDTRFEEFSLKPMPLERVRDIIEGPAKVAGVTVEEALVSAAIRDAATDDALPLLAFALRELYDQFGATRTLSLSSYRAFADEKAGLSPIDNAVRRRADQTIEDAKPSAAELLALKNAFIPSMVRVNAEGEYVRRPAHRDQLPAGAGRLIERLAKARLLQMREERGSVVVEVTHEALLRKWPLLRGWLDEEREFLIGKDQLEQDLREWNNAPADQKDEALLTGLKLTRGRQWLIDRPQQLSDAERKFIQAAAARQAAELARRERLRRYIQFGSMAAALILAVVAAIAFWQRGVAKAALVEAERNYQLALDQAAGSVNLLTKSFEDGAISNRLMQQLIEKAQQTLNELPGEADEVKAARAQLLEVLSIANLALGNVVNGRRFAETGLELAESLRKKHPNDRRWIRLVQLAHGQMSEVFYWSGDGDRALQEAMTAKDIAAKLAESKPDDEDLQWDLSDQYRRIGAALDVIGHLDKGMEAHRAWLKIATDQIARNPESTRWLARLASANREIGNSRMQSLNYTEAVGAYRESVRILSQLLARHPGNAGYLHTLAGSRERVGDALLGLNDIPGALSEYDAALEMTAKLLKTEPTSLRWRQLLQALHQRIGEVHLKKREHDEALRVFRTYLSLTEETLTIVKDNGGALYDVANARQKVGDAFREKGDLAEALGEYQESQKIAIELNRRIWNGSWSKLLAMNHQRMGMVLEARQDRSGAIVQFQECVKVRVNKFAWSPRTLWPPDVIEFCNQQLARLGAQPR